jgi:alanine racemase
MDMIMVNVTNLQLEEGERVEIIGEHQTILDFAQKAKTISYEVMTSFSQRVHRVYIGQ